MVVTPVTGTFFFPDRQWVIVGWRDADAEPAQQRQQTGDGSIDSVAWLACAASVAGRAAALDT